MVKLVQVVAKTDRKIIRNKVVGDWGVMSAESAREFICGVHADAVRAPKPMTVFVVIDGGRSA